MAKYRVLMEEKIFYEIYVEADNEDEAAEIAQNSLDEAEVYSDQYVEVVDVEEETE